MSFEEFSGRCEGKKQVLTSLSGTGKIGTDHFHVVCSANSAAEHIMQDGSAKTHQHFILSCDGGSTVSGEHHKNGGLAPIIQICWIFPTVKAAQLKISLFFLWCFQLRSRLQRFSWARNKWLSPPRKVMRCIKHRLLYISAETPVYL